MFSAFDTSNPTAKAYLQDVVAAHHEIENAMPRASAVTACAMIDDRIEHAISMRLRGDQGAQRKFFGFSGMTAEQKVILGYLLGIYGPETKDNLRALSRIRNKFAHRMDIRDFTHPDLAELIKSLTIYKRLNSKMIEVQIGMLPAPPNSEPTAREKFVMSAMTILGYLAFDAFDHAPYPQFDPRF